MTVVPFLLYRFFFWFLLYARYLHIISAFYNIYKTLKSVVVFIYTFRIWNFSFSSSARKYLVWRTNSKIMLISQLPTSSHIHGLCYIWCFPHWCCRCPLHLRLTLPNRRKKQIPSLYMTLLTDKQTDGCCLVDQLLCISFSFLKLSSGVSLALDLAELRWASAR